MMNMTVVSVFQMPEENEKQVKLKEGLKKLRENEIITYRVAPIMTTVIVLWFCFILRPETYLMIPVFETTQCI